MKLDEILSYIEQEVPELSIGTSLFQHSMPEGVDGVLVRDNPYGSVINHELPKYRKNRFQVIVRAKDFLTASNLADTISSVLTISEKVMPGMEVRYIRPRHDPVSYPVSAGNYVEFSINFDAVFVLV